MTDSLDQQIRDWIARYLAGDVSLPEFEEWFTGTTWDADGQGKALAGEIQLRLAEFSNGDWTENELRDRLAAFAPEWATKPVITTDSTDDATPVPFSVAGTRPGVVVG